jgi:thiol-disulfide isomerase/thioredoxin
MRFFNKYFFLGLASGVILVILLIPLGGYLAYQLWLKSTLEEAAGMHASLPPPPFPDSSYGQMDYSGSVRALNGTEVQLSDFKGKPIYLNLWATWCQPCVAEMPSIENLYLSLKNEEVVFLVVSDENEETVQDFIENRQFTLPVYLSGEHLPEVFRPTGLPTTFIVDRSGTIVFKHVGAARWDHESSLGFLRALL